MARCETRRFGAVRGEIIFVIQLAIDSSGNSGSHRALDRAAVAAHQNDEHNLRMALIGVGNKPAQTRTVFRARSGLAERLLVVGNIAVPCRFRRARPRACRRALPEAAIRC